MELTQEQKSGAVDLLITLAETIRDVMWIPRNDLFFQVADRVEIGPYNVLIDSLKRTGLIIERNHLLIWKGK